MQVCEHQVGVKGSVLDLCIQSVVVKSLITAMPVVLEPVFCLVAKATTLLRIAQSKEGK